MHKQLDHAESGTASLKSYIIGLTLSVFLTLAAYFLVVEKVFAGMGLAVCIMALAVVQFVVQVLCFLGLSKETKPRWNAMMFCFMLLVVVILVGGSLWIMNNLNYNVMPHMNMHTNLKTQN